MANDLWLLNDGTSKILLNNGTDRLALNSEAAAEVTIDKWHRTGGMIRRAATLAVIGQITFAAVPVPADVPVVRAADAAVVYTKTVLAPAYASCPYVPDIAQRWHAPFSTPPKAKVRPPEYQAVFYSPYIAEVVAETVTIDKWHRQHGVVFIKPSVAVTGNIQFGAIPPDTFHVVKAADVPVIFNQTRLSPAYAYSPYVEVAAEVVTSDKWGAAVSQPRFVKRVTGEEGSFFYVGDDPDKYGWRGPLSEPTRRNPLAREGDYTTAPTQAQANDGIGWHRPFSEPTRRKTFLEGDVAFSPTQPEANDGIGWHRPFNEPTRRKVFLEGDSAYSPTLVEDAAIQAKWFQPFGMPRAAKRVPEFPAYFYSPYFVPPISGVGTALNWWPNLAERLRQKQPVAQQQSLIQGPQSPIAVTLEYAWHRPLSEPVRRKAEAQTAGARFAPFPQITIAWQQPLSTPTRRVVRQAYSALSWPGQTISGVTGVASVTLGAPVFSRHVIAQTLAFVYPPVDVAWHQPLSVPVRRKRQAQTAGAAFVYAPAQPGVGVGTDQPWPPFGEPVRFRLSVRTSQQQFLIYYPLLLSSDLDPACRVIDTFETGVVVVSADDVVVTFGQSDVTPAADEDLIPHPGNTVKVKC
jgi:hypothetical protein